MTQRISTGQAADYGTARDIARIYGVPLGTVYRWASEDRWRRTERRPVRYHWDDVEKSREQRRLTS